MSIFSSESRVSELRNYFVQMDANSDPNELKTAILEFYFDPNLPDDDNTAFIVWMKKALEWKCHKIATKYFYNKSVKSTQDENELVKLLFEAAASNQVEFVKLFVSMGIGFQKKQPEELKKVFDVRKSLNSSNKHSLCVDLMAIYFERNRK